MRSGTVEARMAKRARIVLLAADGASNRNIAAIVDLHYNQVGLWRNRYAEFGLSVTDEDRPGRWALGAVRVQERHAHQDEEQGQDAVLEDPVIEVRSSVLSGPR